MSGNMEARNEEARKRRDLLIKPLLEAENEARQIVIEAKAGKIDKLEQAKNEAKKELAGYRAQMDLDFQKKVEEGSGDLDATMRLLEKQTQAKVSVLAAEANLKSNVVVKMLVNAVTNVRV